MSDTSPSAVFAPPGVFDNSRQPRFLSPTDAAAPTSLPGSVPPAFDLPSLHPARPQAMLFPAKGRVSLRTEVLRYLRHQRLMSQQDLADDCWRRNIRLSIATIKRAESAESVRFRTAREFARCFNVPVECLLLDAAT
jgi:hypothetical protein